MLMYPSYVIPSALTSSGKLSFPCLAIASSFPQCSNPVFLLVVALCPTFVPSLCSQPIGPSCSILSLLALSVESPLFWLYCSWTPLVCGYNKLPSELHTEDLSRLFSISSFLLVVAVWGSSFYSRKIPAFLGRQLSFKPGQRHQKILPSYSLVLFDLTMAPAALEFTP